MTNKTTARLVGALFLLATATYITGSGMLDSILTAPDYLSQVYPNRTQVTISVLLEYVDAIAVFGIGMLLYPILKRHNETVAAGYAGTRIFEAVMLVVAGLSSLSLIALSQGYVQAGAQDVAYFQMAGSVLMAESNLAFQIAMLGLGLGSLPFCVLLYRSKLVPRWLAILGIVGYVTLFTSALLAVFGAGADIANYLYVPGAIFELVLPVLLIVKGFSSGAVEQDGLRTSNA